MAIPGPTGRAAAEPVQLDGRVEGGSEYDSNIHRLERRGWIESEWGLSKNNRRAKYYQLTPQGRQQLGAKTTTWAQYAAAVTRVLAVGAAGGAVP